MTLCVDVLLDRAARAADADRVDRNAVALDEALLRHDRRLGAEHEVVVRARPRAARVDDRVALREADVVEAAAAAGRALDVADRHAAVEGVDQAAVPERGVRRRRGVAGRREDRDRVDEAVDRAALAANHVRHGASVERGGRRGVRRERSGRQRNERAAGRAVDEVDDPVDRAVPAPADRRRRRVPRRLEEPHADALLVVDEREAETGGLGLADERLLLRSGEDRPRDGMVRQRHACRRAAVAATVRVDEERVRAEPETGDHARVRARGVVPLKRRRDVGAVQQHRRLLHGHRARNAHLDERVAAGDHARGTRKHANREVLCRLCSRDGGAAQRTDAGERSPGRSPHVPLSLHPW